MDAYVRSVCSARDRCEHASSSETVWIEQQIAMQQMACKTTIIFSMSADCSKIQFATEDDAKNKFEKRFRITASGSFDFEITASGSFVVQDSTCRSFWYRSDFNNERIRELSEFVWFLRIRVVCYHVAKLHTTMWQSPIKVAGADHAV